MNVRIVRKYWNPHQVEGSNNKNAQDEDDEKLLNEIIEIQDDEEMNEDQIDTTVKDICDSQASEIKRDVIFKWKRIKDM